MNTPEINMASNITPGNAVNSGMNSGMGFSDILGFLQQIMQMKDQSRALEAQSRMMVNKAQERIPGGVDMSSWNKMFPTRFNS